MSTLHHTHLVSVWNPSYAVDAMEAHLQILLDWAARYDNQTADDDDIYVYWGKVRSPNRQQQQANLEHIRALAKTISQQGAETQLYLTDYRSLYVGDVDAIIEGDLPNSEQTHVPAYYRNDNLNCDFWFKLIDIRRLVADNLPGVIAELKKLRNIHYADRPVSLYGGMVDLPLLVFRPDGEQFFDEDVRDAVTDGGLWAEFDADAAAGLAAMERELRENVFGDVAWGGLELTTRTFIATAEHVFRTHRHDKAFDFSPVLTSFSKALEVQCNAILRQALRNAPLEARLAKIDDRTRDVSEGRPLAAGQLARAIGGERLLNRELVARLENGSWFANEFAVMLDSFSTLRNDATHEEAIGRDIALHWRNRLMGVGCLGDLAMLGKVKVKGR